MASQATDKQAQRRSVEGVIEKILAMDLGIRMVAVYQGQYMLAGGMRQGVQPYDSDDAYDIDMQLSKMGEFARQWQTWFGKLEGLTLKYEKLSLTFHPISEERFLTMSTEPSVNPVTMMGRIRAMPDFRKLARSIP